MNIDDLHPSLREHLLPLPADAASANDFTLHFDVMALRNIAAYAQHIQLTTESALAPEWTVNGE